MGSWKLNNEYNDDNNNNNGDDNNKNNNNCDDDVGTKVKLFDKELAKAVKQFSIQSKWNRRQREICFVLALILWNFVLEVWPDLAKNRPFGQI